MLDVNKSLEFLKLEGLPVINSPVVDSIDGLRFVCEELGYPLVMKINSSVHKTDKGGVITSINSFDGALSAFKKLRLLSKEVIVQQQFSGVELIIGVKKDPVFNQVLMFGFGGLLVELLKDVSFRVCPINKVEALGMINELKSSKLLSGYRGKVSVNIKSLIELLVKLSNIVVDNDVKELDINPLISSGNDLRIVDARLIL